MVWPFGTSKKIGAVQKPQLSFEEKLDLARSLQERRVVVGGVCRDIVGIDEKTACVRVRIGLEDKLYDPTDLVVDQRS